MEANELKNLRSAKGLSQRKLAELLGIGKRGRLTVSDWENGRNKISRGFELALKNILEA